VVERIDYDAYGRGRHHHRADINGDGIVSSQDIFDALTHYANNPTIGQTGLQYEYNPDADFDNDGSLTSQDLFDFFSWWYAATNANTIPPPSGWISNRDVNAYPGGLVTIAPDNPIGFCGYVFNTEIASGGLYTVRHRHYMPDIGRWLERDPAGFVDGANLYEYGMSSPPTRNDPLGLWSDHARETLDNTKDKYCKGLRKDYCKGKITEEQYAKAVEDAKCGVSVQLEIAQTLKEMGRGSGSFWEGLYDGFVVTTNAAVQTLTFGLLGYSLDELRDGGHLYDPDDPNLVYSSWAGRVAGAALSYAATTKLAAAAYRWVNLSDELVVVSRWGRPGLKSGDWVMTGIKSRLNWLLSGKPQTGLSNQYAPYGSGVMYLVPRSSLRLPVDDLFWPIKALLGQRKVYFWSTAL
jgi:RHS repeat-associated protein